MDVADWCSYKLIVEPSNLFLPYISQRGDFLSLKGRQRQGLIPDLLDVKRNTLLDVKGFTWGNLYRPIRFKQARTCGAVEMRADQVHRDYLKKAHTIDHKYNSWDRPDPGPVQSALLRYGRVEGLAVGAHGEGSMDLIKLLDRIAARGADRRFRDLGFDSAIQAKNTIKKHVFMTVGIEAMRGMARLRLNNLGSALAGPVSCKAASARRTKYRSKHRDHNDCY